MDDQPTDLDIEDLLRSAPSQRWRQLWGAVAALEADVQPVHWDGGQADIDVVGGVDPRVIHMRYPEYGESVKRTIRALYDLGAVVSFDASAWDGTKRFPSSRDLDDTTVANAIRMITWIVRADRFTGGTISETLENGTLLAALRRVRRWYDEADLDRRLPGV